MRSAREDQQLCERSDNSGNTILAAAITKTPIGGVRESGAQERT